MNQPAVKGLITWKGKYMRTKARFFSLIVFVFFIQIILISVAAAAIRIMPLGDSITSGYDDVLPDTEWGGYRQKLYSDLIDEGYDVDFVGGEQDGENIIPPFDTDHEGHRGWAAHEIVNGNPLEPWAGQLDQWLVAYKPDIVLLHIGTNDISDWQAPAEIRDEIEDILEEIDAYEVNSGTEVMVFLALIINRENPGSPLGQDTSALNVLLQTLVVNRLNAGDKIRVVDQENALIYPGDIANDTYEVHPTTTGYNKMADEWFYEVDDYLSPDPDPPNNSSSSNLFGCFISTVAE